MILSSDRHLLELRQNFDQRLVKPDTSLINKSENPKVGDDLADGPNVENCVGSHRLLCSCIRVSSGFKCNDLAVLSDEHDSAYRETSLDHKFKLRVDSLLQWRPVLNSGESFWPSAKHGGRCQPRYEMPPVHENPTD